MNIGSKVPGNDRIVFRKLDSPSIAVQRSLPHAAVSVVQPDVYAKERGPPVPKGFVVPRLRGQERIQLVERLDVSALRK